MPKWDKHVDYDEVLPLLAAEVQKERHIAVLHLKGEEIDPFAVVRLGWLICYSSQIVAGCRASEAFDAFMGWLRTGETHVAVRVRKKPPACATCGHIKTSRHADVGHETTGVSGQRGKCKRFGCSCLQYVPKTDNVETVTVGVNAPEGDRMLLQSIIDSRTLTGYKKFVRRRSWLGSTHSARYSLINKLTADGVPNAVISKTTRQALATVEHYQNEELAKKLKRGREDEMKKLLAGQTVVEGQA